jgi:hypothetical protein
VRFALTRFGGHGCVPQHVHRPRCPRVAPYAGSEIDIWYGAGPPAHASKRLRSVIVPVSRTAYGNDPVRTTSVQRASRRTRPLKIFAEVGHTDRIPRIPEHPLAVALRQSAYCIPRSGSPHCADVLAKEVPNYSRGLTTAGRKARPLRAALHRTAAPRRLGPPGAAFVAINPKAAPGVDKVTWDAYGQDLRANLEDLLRRVHSGAYRASPSRRVYIPKPDGRLRPLGRFIQSPVVAPAAL